MDVEFQNDPAFTVAVARLAGGEKLRAESGAMISMTTGTQIETTTQGGILKGLKRSFSGESFFMNMFTAPPSGGEILLASSLPGDMTYVDLQGETWLFHRDGFIAAEQTIDLDTKWGGLKGAFGASSFFVVKCSGRGKAIVATYTAPCAAWTCRPGTSTRSTRAISWPGRRACPSRCTRSAASSRCSSAARASW